MSAFSRRLRGAAQAARRLARHGRPPRTLLFGPHALGDDLLCTTILREGARRGRRFAMMTDRPELFLGNADAAQIIPVDDYYAAALRRLGAEVIRPYYRRADPSGPNCSLPCPRPILAEMCRLAGLTGEITLRPYLALSRAEREAGRRFPRQLVLQSTCLSAALPIPTKEWGPARMAEVARLLARDFHLIQLGRAADPALPVQTDLRGRTTLREAAAILAGAEALVGLEGFLTHLARAVDCPAVVVMGGREPPEHCAYVCNQNLFGTVRCAPCHLLDGCPNQLECMSVITPAQVVAAVAGLTAHPPERPLAAETFILPGG
jgi:hypothetical protein